MTTQAIKPHQLHLAREDDLWLPPRRLRRYQWNKVVGGCLMSMIFVGWLLLQWSNPTMRLVAGGLICVTGWVLIQSITNDCRRDRGRQVKIADGELMVTAPHGMTQIRLDQVAQARWDEDSHPGLWLYDTNGRTLIHIDAHFLPDQAEARSFLGWARKHADLPFDVHWPVT